MKILKLVTLILLITQTVVVADNSFGENRTNVWVDNGVSGKTFSIEEWSENANFGSGNIKVAQEIVTNTDASNVTIFVNNIPTSYPKIESNLPIMSLVGLDSATNNIGDPLDSATLKVTPNGGVFNDTIEVKIELISKLGDKQKVHLKKDGVLQDSQTLVVSDNNNGFSLFFSANGTHTLEYMLEGDSYFQTVEFVIKNENQMRDSDSDGIPDVVEIELGTDPFELDTESGWSALDKYMRENSLGDKDGDGWSDFDEEKLRGTDPDSNLSTPTATSLYGVEYRVSSHVLRGDDNLTSLSRVSFVDIKSNKLYDTKEFQNYNEENSTLNSAISSLKGTKLTNFLQNAKTPIVRVPASSPVIARIRESNKSNSWIGKSYIASHEDLDVKNFYTVFANDKSVEKVNLESFTEAYIQYLKTNVVIDKNISVDDNSSINVALLELAFKTRVESSTSLLLGHPDFIYDTKAYVNTINALKDTNRTVNSLVLDLKSLSQHYPLGMESLQEYIASDGNLTEVSLVHFMQNMLQESEVYKVSLMTIVDFSTSNVQVKESKSPSVFTSDVDSDFDGLLNKEEVLSVSYTNPLDADWDGDLLIDSEDPCPIDRHNSCLNDSTSQADGDEDGIVDSIDNCPFDKNDNQEDSDFDGIGDVCAKKEVVVINPRTSIQLLKNASFTFQAKKTSENEDMVAWSVNGNTVLENSLEFLYQFTSTGEKNVCASLDAERKSCLTVTVLDSYENDSVTMYAASILEGNSDKQNALVEIVLDSSSKAINKYTYTTSDMIATAGEDYEETSGELTFSIGERRKYIEVPIIGDEVSESNELFKVLLSQNGDIVAEANLFILNDDMSSENNESNATNETNATTPFYLFSASDKVHGIEPWVTDGTIQGTKILKNIALDANSSYPNNFTRVGEKIYFSAYDSNYSTLLYVSDGTEAGTVAIHNFGIAYIDSFTVVDTTLYLRSSDEGAQLYSVQGEDVTFLTALSTGYEGGITYGGNIFTKSGDYLYYLSNLLTSDEYDSELHKYSINDNNISLVKELNPEGNAYITNMTSVNDTLYFVFAKDTDASIYKTDGTAEGTEIIVENIPDYAGENSLLNIGEHLYYYSNRTNGQDDNETKVVDYNISSQIATTLYTRADGTHVNGIYSVDNKFYFTTSLYNYTTHTISYQIIDVDLELLTSRETGIFSFYSNLGKFYYVTDDAVYNSEGVALLDKVNSDAVSFLNGSLNEKILFYFYRQGQSSLYITDGTVGGTKELLSY